MIQRIVCFKFKAGTTKESIRKHMDHFARLKEDISQITGYSGSLTCPDEHGTPPDYDSLHYVTFNNMEDVRVYFHHPAHQEFIEQNKALWEDVLVLNAGE